MRQWKHLIDGYLKARRTAGFSHATMELTARWLNKFMVWCLEQQLRQPAQITAAEIERYRQFLLCVPGLHSRFYSLNSVDQALRTLRQFFHWATERRRLLISPTQELLLPRIDPRYTHLSVDQVQHVLDTAVSRGTSSGLRDRALIATLYYGAMRRSECLRLQLTDLDLERRTLRVAGRFGERIIAVQDLLAAALHEYLEQCRPKLVRTPQQALFVSNIGTPYNTGCLAEMFKRLNAHLEFRITTHILRHSAAVHMMEQGIEPTPIAQMLGLHSAEAMTCYKHIATNAMQRKSHPARRPGRSMPHFSSLIEDVDDA